MYVLWGLRLFSFWLLVLGVRYSVGCEICIVGELMNVFSRLKCKLESGLFFFWVMEYFLISMNGCFNFIIYEVK